MATDAKRKGAEALLHNLPLPEGEAGWVREARAAARARLLDAGAPVRRDEYWKYTDPTALTSPLRPVEEGESAPEIESQFGDVHPRRLRFVNGRHRDDLSHGEDEKGVRVELLGEVLRRDLGPARDLFGRLEAAGHEKVARPLAMLNTAAARDGVAIHVTGRPATPIHLRYDQIGEGASLIHHLVRVEKGASLLLLESGAASNTVIEVDIVEGGSFHHVRIQEGPRQPEAAHLFARIGAGATFKSFCFTADGTLTRNETVVEFAGDDGVGHVAGAIMGKDTAHVDNTIFITHGAERCESRQVFKHVLTGEARGVFQGKIFVRPGAQKTDGYQMSQAVLLTDGAEFSVKPELEIHADDVACSHGSTTGSLDETALFYLRSRGVPHAIAEAMLVEAFVDEAIEEIESETVAGAMRAHVRAWMESRD